MPIITAPLPIVWTSPPSIVQRPHASSTRPN
jgi:hypothetical protein